MKNYFILICFVVVGCARHKDPGFTSVAGNWTYTTPDAKVTITFQLATVGADSVSISKQTMKLDGTLYQSAAEISGVSLLTFKEIRINANDIVAVYPYSIEFDNCTVSSDFKTINVANASYTWPWGKTNPLTALKITRQ